MLFKSFITLILQSKQQFDCNIHFIVCSRVYKERLVQRALKENL